MKVGILVHGLFLQAKNWEATVWGSNSELGSLPKAVQVMSRFGFDNIGHVVFGTGASERDGLKEAEYTRREVYLNTRRIQRQFPDALVPHVGGSSTLVHLLWTLLQDATLEVDAKNTVEEIANAALHFAKHDCDLIIQVPTCGSHAPRCVKTYLQVRKAGKIPDGQVWMIAPPDTTFADSTIDDVAIVEPPHRADDPMLSAPVKAHQVVPRLFKMSPDVRKQFLIEADRLLRVYGV